MVDLKYANAFSEVLEILRYIPKEDYEKIPLEIIEMFEDNCNADYSVEYTPTIDLISQNISKEARIIIAIFFRDYWATPSQKEKINTKEKDDMQKLEEEKRKKYNPNNLFKNREIIDKANVVENTENSNQNKVEENSLVEYQENFFTKFKNFIFKLLHIKS